MADYVETNEPETVAACPECDVAGEVYHRVAPNRQGDETYRCYKCGARFNTYVERDAKTERDNPNSYTSDGLPRGLSDDTKAKLRAIRAADQ